MLVVQALNRKTELFNRFVPLHQVVKFNSSQLLDTFQLELFSEGGDGFVEGITLTFRQHPEHNGGSLVQVDLQLVEL